MLPKLRLLLVAAAAAALLPGCSDTDDGVTGQGSIAGLHAIPDVGNIDFLIEETLLATLNYKEASGTSAFDDLEYDFNFDILLPGDSDETRIATTTVAVNADTEYTFVLAGTLTDPEIIVWQQFGRDWQEELDEAEDNDTEVTVMEVSFGHVDPALGAVDVFLESPGTSPLAATPRGTLSYGELLTAIELEAGDYQLLYTAQADPSTILFASDPIEVVAATSNLFVVMDDGGITTADFSVRWIGTSLGLELLDIAVEPRISALHTAFGSGDVDIIIGDDFSAPLISQLAYTDSTDDRIVDDGTININVTPAGNPGVFLAEKETEIDPGSYNRLYLAGLPGDMQLVVIEEDRRRLATHARVQIFQGAARFQTLDVYLVKTDVDIALISPSYSSLLFGTGTAYTALEADSYNLVLTEPGTKNVIGGPLLVEFELGRNYGIVITDADDITAADALIYDQTPQ